VLVLATCCGLAGGLTTAAAQDNPLETEDLTLIAKPDLSSPRAVLMTLRQNIDRAYRLLIEVNEEHRTSPGFGVSAEVAEKVATARLHLRRAMASLDLSQVAAANRQETGLESVLLLKEIIDRLPAVPAETVPGTEEVAAAELKNAPINDWRLPNSDIHIVKPAEGEHAGEYVVSAGTVAQLPDFYDLLKTYSQRPDASADFFEFYTLTPGKLLPPRWYLWVEMLPPWTRAPIAGQAVWQWIGLALVLLVLFGGYWRFLWRRRPVLPVSPARHYLSRMVSPLVLIAICMLAVATLEQLNITGVPFIAFNSVLHALGFLASAWLANLFAAVIAEWVISSPRINPASLDASLIRLMARTLGIAAAVAIVFWGATDIGLPLYGLIAGLGVGGLALGLAARPTLENLIGGLILHADKPVRVGDFCQFGDKRGTIEEIGLRSTRIRALDRTLVTVPNAEFSTMELINYTRRDRTHLRRTIGLRYETTADQLREVLDRLRAYLAEHQAVIGDTARVRFIDLGDYALGVEIYAYIDRPGNSEFLEIQEEILFAVMRIVEECGTAIAFPTQTTYYARDPGLATQADAAAPAR
jgi:MscS family membrane protein